jgi:hypothetical protein
MNDANGKPAMKRTFPFLTLKLFHFPAHAGMTAVQGVSSGAPSWPGSPIISVLANLSGTANQ